MPMTVTADRIDEWGGYVEDEPEQLTDQEAIDYADIIRDAILKERMPEEAERGLMIYHNENDSLNAKVQSFRFDVDVRLGKLWSVAECELREPLNASEMSDLIEAIVGLASDGFGEGFEQRELKIPDNITVYPSEWETGNAEKNREIVDYHNQRRGITSAQEEAMVGGSMFGWDTPAADPSAMKS